MKLRGHKIKLPYISELRTLLMHIVVNIVAMVNHGMSCWKDTNALPLCSDYVYKKFDRGYCDTSY